MMSGLYRIPQLPVGTYEVKVEKAGFSSVAYPAFMLSLNQVARIDVEMKVGQVSETVEVTGAAPILKTESTQVDTIIDAATNDALPLATRNYVELTLLSPGAVHPDPSSFNNGDNVQQRGAAVHQRQSRAGEQLSPRWHGQQPGVRQSSWVHTIA